jgi:hypothetical protein
MIYERALLSALIARSFDMTEAYAQEYLRFMIVAGDALGHARVCEMGHDDTLHDDGTDDDTGPRLPTNFGSIWTMLPFDLARSDEDLYGKTMEDPCKPRYGGFTTGMDADEIRGRAHAKALIQR